MLFDRWWRYASIAVLSLLFVVGSYALYRTYPGRQAVSSAPGSIEPSIVNACGTSKSGETANPITQHYGESAYPWTNEIRWQCVYNIEAFPGRNADDRFRAARAAAIANGGGVIYFPAGVYRFSDTLVLSDNIVVRGQTPTITDAQSPNFQPPTRFEFPQYEPQFSGNGTPNETAFKKISIEHPGRDANFGLVYIDLDRAAVQLAGDPKTTQSHNIIIFGLRNNNVAEPDPNVPDRSFQKPWFRYSSRFAANLKIDAAENILVANNRLNDAITDNFEQPGYTVKSLNGNDILTYRDGGKVPFHYGNHYGIVVNRSGQFQPSATPETSPELFRPGIVIRDNWVYHTMRVGIHAAGTGLVIRDNIVRDEPDKIWWTDATGLKQPRGANTLENRAIDWSGWNVEIEGNDLEVYRHRLGDTGYLSVDGEGILIQACCGGTTVNGLTIRDNRSNAYLGLYKVGDIQNVSIDRNRVESIYVVADTNNRSYSMENVRVENNTVSSDITVVASAGGRNNAVVSNRGSGKISRSCHVQVRNNMGFDDRPCLSALN